MTISDPLDQHGKILRSKGAYDEVFGNLRKIEGSIFWMQEVLCKLTKMHPAPLEGSCSYPERECCVFLLCQLEISEKLISKAILEFEKIVVVEPLEERT